MALAAEPDIVGNFMASSTSCSTSSCTAFRVARRVALHVVSCCTSCRLARRGVLHVELYVVLETSLRWTSLGVPNKCVRAVTRTDGRVSGVQSRITNGHDRTQNDPNTPQCVSIGTGAHI